MEEALAYYKDYPGFKAKSLFIRNRKGTKHYLVIVSDQTRVDLKKLAQTLGESQVGFASPERLKKYLNVTPGSVSPLGLVYDTEKAITLIIDQTIQQHELVNFHPNDNTKTIVMTTKDFFKFVDNVSPNYQLQTL